MKLLERFPLGVENLHGLRARQSFLQKGVDAGQPRADAVVAAPRALAEPTRRKDEHRDGDERDECQLPVHPEHHPDDGRDHHQVAEHVNHARGEQLVERVHVRGEPRHHAPDRVAVVVGDLLALQLAVKLAPEVVHHALAHGFEQHGLQVREPEGDEEHGEEDEREPFQSADVARRDVPVNRVLRELRLKDAQQIEHERQHERGQERAQVRLQVAHQPARHLPVVSLADGLFFVKLFDRRRHVLTRSALPLCFPESARTGRGRDHVLALRLVQHDAEAARGRRKSSNTCCP